MSDKIQILIEIDKKELEDIIDTLDLSVPKKPRRAGWSLVTRRNADRLIDLLRNSTLPENATNGNVFKTMFHNAEIEENCELTSGEIVVFITDGARRFMVSQNWWNAPYQKGE